MGSKCVLKKFELIHYNVDAYDSLISLTTVLMRAMKSFHEFSYSQYFIIIQPNSRRYLLTTSYYYYFQS